jgi:D-alanyl-D-alanine carboxypeptidase/D-alanyl-D-alanine-endopeptidase (penicillin-binding protein 4)
MPRAHRAGRRDPDPALAQAFLGICYPSRRLYRNARRRFMPASTTKLYTSWLACEALGEDHVFHSEYAVDGKTLYVAPMGNPLLSEDSFRALLDDVRGRNLEEIAIVSSVVEGPRYPTTWAIGDLREAWGAPLSDVCFGENAGAVDGTRDSIVRPSGSYFSMKRVEGLQTPSVEGAQISLPPGFRGTYEFPILDPEDFLFHWLKERLGVNARRVRSRPPPGSAISFAEAPLRDVLRRMNKPSSNILAELLLIHSARALHQPLDYERPQAAFTEVLGRLGIRDALLWDGSGVSRYNLVSPAGTVALLEAATKYPSIAESLPIGGKDGTLAKRKLPRRIHAKTGSLTGVQALAGYDDGQPFSIVINHGPTDEQVMIDAIDRIVNRR